MRPFFHGESLFRLLEFPFYGLGEVLLHGGRSRLPSAVEVRKATEVTSTASLSMG